jgi:hypothetical protein
MTAPPPPGPANTAAYYHAAYIVAGGLYGIYVLSLWWRARRLRK